MPALKNSRQERFALGLVSGLPASRAYEDAGYKPSDANASRLTRNDRVRARVAELQQQAAAKVVVDKAWVLEHLTTLVQRSMREVPVVDKRGKPTGEYAFQGATAARGLELLGKELGMFKQQVEQTIDLGRIWERVKRARASAQSAPPMTAASQHHGPPEEPRKPKPVFVPRR